ncbi:hypothetical protein [Cysteiniphilum litorale]|uniref:hypothetical protein n=1 Tax=Cysteiniphilum litorale TaxID=2056700 RepID=UPI003F885986
MNDNQKEKLLNLAESNPELAREMMEFLKEDSSHQEPIAVKMVKSEEDKIEITAEQRKYALLCFVAILAAVIAVFINVITFILNVHTINFSDAYTAFMFTGIFVGICILIFYFCAYQAGIPTIKKIMLRYFKC